MCKLNLKVLNFDFGFLHSFWRAHQIPCNLETLSKLKIEIV